MTQTAPDATEALRAEIRAWLESTMRELRDGLPPTLSEADEMDFRRRYAKCLARDGWIGLSWDPRWGGRGMTRAELLVFAQESVRVDAPEPLGRHGTDILGPAIAVYGTEAQCERFLPPILAAEEVWCQGFSEPGAGSDLASLRTRAKPDGDGWRINGQKIWTTVGQYADLCLVLARTDPDARPHAGISAFAVDMRAPGVTVRPIEQITGAHEFCEIFFDDVHVPGDCLIGLPGQGWKFAMATLEFERGLYFMSRQVRLTKDVNDLVAHVQQNADLVPERIKDRLVDVYVKSQELQAAVDFHIESSLGGERPGPDNNATKVFWSETYQELADIGAEVDSLLVERPVGGKDWSQFYLEARAATIYAGTSEIQRNIIAERGLGLPR